MPKALTEENLGRWIGMVLIAVVCLPAYGQPAADVKVDWDVVQFAGAEGQTRIESFLAFDAAALPFAADSVGFSASLPVRLAFIPRGGGVEPDETQAVLRFSMLDPATLVRGQSFLHRLTTMLLPGDYRARLVIGEGVIARPRTVERDLQVRKLTGGEPSQSDLLPASDISDEVEEGALFRRGTLAIEPNPRRVYGAGMSRLFYYVEGYGFEVLESPPAEVHVFIAETHLAQPIGGLENRSPAPSGDFGAAYGSFDLSEVPNGSYRLMSRWVDEADSTLASGDTRFFVYNPGVTRRAPTAAAAGETLPDGAFATLPAEEFDQLFEQSRLVATQDESRRMRRMKDDAERRRFLTHFWENRDPSPGRPGNAALDDFTLRIQYANDRFGGRSRDGWQSDRGRVVTRYGIPDDIEERPNETGRVAYTVWNYTNIQGIGQAIFVFADTMGFNTFELIHSNVPGERQSVDWQAELRRTR